jgi:hypothetical protein
MGGDAAMGYIFSMKSDDPDSPSARAGPKLGSRAPRGDGKSERFRRKFVLPPWYWLALVGLILGLPFLLSRWRPRDHSL